MSINGDEAFDRKCFIIKIFHTLIEHSVEEVMNYKETKNKRRKVIEVYFMEY
jgi:hypothetical protein